MVEVKEKESGVAAPSASSDQATPYAGQAEPEAAGPNGSEVRAGFHTEHP